MVALSPSIAEALIWAAILVPLLLGILALRPARLDAAWAGAIGALPVLALGAGAMAGIINAGEMPVGWLLFGATLGIDGLSGAFATLTGVLWLCASIACAGYFDAATRRALAPGWLFAMAGNAALAVSLDPLTYFVFFAIMSFASYALVVQRGDQDAQRAGAIYLAFVIIGEVILFAGLALGGFHPVMASLALMVGFGIKVGVVGLHVWLPLAHGAAPAPASAVLSGAMLKAGLLGWLRFFDPATLAGSANLGLDLPALLMVLGFAGALLGALLGLTQRDAKTVLAYSSVSQMGLITLAFGMGLAAASPPTVMAGTLGLLAMHHAFAKGALFLGVPLLAGTRGAARTVALVLMAVAALSLVGLPLTSGAAAKGELKALATELGGERGDLVAWLLPVAATGTALVLARVFALLPGPGDRTAGAATWLPAGVLVLAGFVLTALHGTQTDAGLAERLNGALEAGPAALAPLAMAAALLVLWRLTPLRAPPLPAGDVLYFALPVARALGRGLLRASAADPARHLRAWMAPLTDLGSSSTSALATGAERLGATPAIVAASVAAAVAIAGGLLMP